jgi:hypothetical protein
MSQSMLAIKNKLGSSANNLRSYASARGLTAPDSMSEFDAWLNPGGGGGGGSCSCYTVVNESGDRNIIFQYNRCSDGQLASMSAPRGARRNVCVQNGGDIIDVSGLLTIVSCGTPCSVNDDCTDCI